MAAPQRWFSHESGLMCGGKKSSGGWTDLVGTPGAALDAPHGKCGHLPRQMNEYAETLGLEPQG
jgi:hypothetical protein